VNKIFVFKIVSMQWCIRCHVLFAIKSTYHISYIFFFFHGCKI
jgi:hypothetical protein